MNIILILLAILGLCATAAFIFVIGFGFGGAWESTLVEKAMKKGEPYKLGGNRFARIIPWETED